MSDLVGEEANQVRRLTDTGIAVLSVGKVQHFGDVDPGRASEVRCGHVHLFLSAN